MPLVMQYNGPYAVPQVLCDYCGEVIPDAQEGGIHVRRDTLLSIAYSEGLIFPISATLQSTDRHHGIVGQERCHLQLDS
jgi:hypothetical protein